MQAADALYPAYGFASHVGYITPAHTKVVRERGPCDIHRRSFQALAYRTEAGVELVAAEAS
jgi:ribonuclease HII